MDHPHLQIAKLSAVARRAIVCLLLAALPLAAENAAPTVVKPARTFVSTVTTNWAVLLVECADDGGEVDLSYTWTTTSAPAGAVVAFEPNGSNEARGTTAIFARAGAYVCTVTATDQGGLSVSSSVAVTVGQSLSAIAVSPATAAVPTNGTRSFAAAGSDQFGHPMTTMPTLAWSVNGGGAVSPAGLFTAGAAAGGPFTVTASAQGRSGSAAVTVVATASPGDTNGDKVVNVVDLINVKQALGTSTGQPGYAASADFNADGAVNIQDLVTVKSLLGTTYP